jgi:predicted Rossmann fold flavoprotein
MLLAECAQGGVDVRVGHTVTDISRLDRFRLETSHGCFTAAALVLATGGLSIPKMGATGFAHDVARRFGLGVVEPLPGLVPLMAMPAALGLDQVLAGVSVEAIASCAGGSFRENILFTHRGLSGPAILQISSYWRPGDAISLDLTPGLASAGDANAFLLERKRSRPRAEAKTVLAEILPARLAHALAQAGLPPGPMADVPDRTLVAFAARLKGWQVRPTGSEGWSKAEVTLGGIDTRGLSSKTMEARDVPGLYAIGEAVDVTGWLGGYNFQWAWSSGWCAGQAVS